jgi:hypothetical protein
MINVGQLRAYNEQTEISTIYVDYSTDFHI